MRDKLVTLIGSMTIFVSGMMPVISFYYLQKICNNTSPSIKDIKNDIKKLE